MNSKANNLQRNINHLNNKMEKLAKEKNDLNVINNYLDNQILTLKNLINNSQANNKSNLVFINPEEIIRVQFKSVDPWIRMNHVKNLSYLFV